MNLNSTPCLIFIISNKYQWGVHIYKKIKHLLWYRCTIRIKDKTMLLLINLGNSTLTNKRQRKKKRSYHIAKCTRQFPSGVFRHFSRSWRFSWYTRAPQRTWKEAKHKNIADGVYIHTYRREELLFSSLERTSVSNEFRISLAARSLSRRAARLF